MSDTEQSDLERLKQLDQKLAKFRKPADETPSQGVSFSQADMAWRMVIELVSGLLVGFGIGYGLDHLFGTKPIFLVLFILLGFAGGVNVMLRSAKEMQNQKAAEAAAEEDDRSGG